MRKLLKDQLNWRNKVTLTAKLIVENNKQFCSEELYVFARSVIAKHLRDVMRNNNFPKGTVSSFVSQLSDVLLKSKITKTNFWGLAQSTKAASRRFPSFSETLTATLKRFDAISDLVKKLDESHVNCGMLVGGSMNYGPFYCVRENVVGEDDSDIDIIVVMPTLTGERINGFIRCLNLSNPRVEVIRKRVSSFLRAISTKACDIFSQMIVCERFGVRLSFHFFDEKGFDLVIGQQFIRSSKANLDITQVVMDFLSAQFREKDALPKNFAGKPLSTPVLKGQQFEDSFIQAIPSYRIYGRALYPSVFMNLSWPDRFIAYERGVNTLSMVHLFQDELYRRFDETDGSGSIINSHARSDYFPEGWW